ncbi:MAG: hypothetical protein N3I35_06505 [Clostridia bacterium]|nr:hypothetical protein [Clostridia bacterium]
MSYQEKRTIVSIITGLLIFGAYCIYTYGKWQSGVIAADDMKFWASTMLVFIGIGIAAAIVIQIVFHILLSIAITIKESVMNGKCDDKEIEKTIGAEMVTDEMDKLIELNSMRIAFVVVGIGFVAALFSQIFSYSIAVMLNIMYLSFYAGSLLEGFVQLYFYRRGIKNG